MTLPPTSTNLLLHVLRTHLQVMLWKSANLQAPPDKSANITHFGWEIKNGIPVPVTDQGDPAPPQLIDVIRCQCKAQGKKCHTEACGCHKEHLSCMSYCNCSGEEGCCNPYTNRRADEEDVQMENIEEEDDEGDEQDGVEMDDIEDGFNQDGEGHEVIDGSFEDPDYDWQ